MTQLSNKATSWGTEGEDFSTQMEKEHNSTHNSALYGFMVYRVSHSSVMKQTSRFRYIILGDQWCVALSQSTIMSVHCFVNCKVLDDSIISWGCWWMIDLFSRKNQPHGFASLKYPRQILFYGPAWSSHDSEMLPGASPVLQSIYSIEKHVQIIYYVLGTFVSAWQMLPPTIPCSLLFTLFVTNVIDIIWGLLIGKQRPRAMKGLARCHTSEE